MLAACFDCGLQYEDARFEEIVIPNNYWRLIAPIDGEGLLCRPCIFSRLAAVNVSDCPIVFGSEDMAECQQHPKALLALGGLA